MTAVELDRVDVVDGQVPLPGMPEDGVLFHIEPPASDPLVGLSSDARRTARQRQLFEQGWHPLTGTRTRPDLGHCGTCAHRVLVGHHGRTYPKCDVGPATHGTATDVRAHWPACDRWEVKP